MCKIVDAHARPVLAYTHAQSPVSTGAYTKKFRPTAFPEGTIKGSRRFSAMREFGVIKRGVRRGEQFANAREDRARVYRGERMYYTCRQTASCASTLLRKEEVGLREGEDAARGWRSVYAGGARAAGNSRSGAATPVTSVGASANQ